MDWVAIPLEETPLITLEITKKKSVANHWKTILGYIEK